MKVFKFGGASIADPIRMQALLPIFEEEKEPLLLVISAIGKTTNALEEIVNLVCQQKKAAAYQLGEKIKQQHLDYARSILYENSFAIAATMLSSSFRELDIAIESSESEAYDMVYDQIVCLGEIFSSCIFHIFLSQNGFTTVWINARQVIYTDNVYRDANIDWKLTKKKAVKIIGSELSAGNIVITQGFIGGTKQGKSSTLGREGSDYTAAVLAAMLKLDSVTIWKDVDGLRNADPKQFKDTIKIDAISYNEVIEMAFYGAQIIHPKTIKPLQNNSIPLFVKCFLNKDLSGTVISENVSQDNLPPLIVLKLNQILLQVTTRDFSFITEDNLSKLYGKFHELKIKVNIIQNAAISFVACIDNQAEKIRVLIDELNKDYKVLINQDVSLLTIRHYSSETLESITKNKLILLKQETRKTVQVVMK